MRGRRAMTKQRLTHLPKDLIDQGFDIHLVFNEAQASEARQVFDAFIEFVEEREIPYQRGMIFEKPVGPWPTPMWQVLLRPESSFAQLESHIGACLGWMMINRGSFSVMIHPNTDESSESGGALRDHRDYCLWLGTPQNLKLSIFNREM
ncbi:MAG: DOPA 4,5-dioxygenase family protein [Planctomycetota bacterium]|nr:DOPA 4,5-dioxygenase family protein [Planctomycetota bacterium]